jgi:hypothetical protein
MRRIGYFCVTFFRSRLRSCVLTRDDPSAFAPPSAFGPFRVLHQIGVGALGPVFRTYEPTRDRLVAVKVFRLDITPEQAQALAAELARAAEAGLFHPSIVEPLAAGVEGTVAYRAEEYVAAESLDVAMRPHRSTRSCRSSRSWQARSISPARPVWDTARSTPATSS